MPRYMGLDRGSPHPLNKGVTPEGHPAKSVAKAIEAAGTAWRTASI